MNWEDAFIYCANEYTDLAQILSSENVTKAMETQTWGYTGKAWIGLFKNRTDWTWEGGLPFSFSKWREGQPDNDKGDEFCVFMDADGTWADDSCSVKKSHICSEGESYNVSTNNMTWHEAKADCEHRGSTLAYIHEKNNRDVEQVLEGLTDVWIGLSKSDLWYWSEAEGNVEFENWKTGQPDNQEDTSCAAVGLSDGTWTDEACETALPFLCYGVNKARKTTLHLKFQSSANLENPALAAELKQQLRLAFAQQGMSELKLTWIKPPVKTPKKQQGDEETCSDGERKSFEDTPGLT
ncbi:macrophage mannose receptor 1-like isoform X2 [Notolabrus celidotus]|nr:macrophage mannose receptor 1-like isoform X2 [Notolabrus celidotus]